MGVFEHEICVLNLLQLSSETFLILRRIERDSIRNVQYIGLHVNYRLFLSQFKEYSRQMFRKYSKVKFHEYPSNCSMQTDGRTNVTKLTVALRNLRQPLKMLHRHYDIR